jgi:hypothetical protein
MSKPMRWILACVFSLGILAFGITAIINLDRCRRLSHEAGIPLATMIDESVAEGAADPTKQFDAHRKAQDRCSRSLQQFQLAAFFTIGLLASLFYLNMRAARNRRILNSLAEQGPLENPDKN